MAIGLSVEGSQLSYIRNCVSGPEAWQALSAIYEANNRANRISLKRQFYTFSHDVEKPIMDYVSGITSLASQLRAIEIKIEDEDIVDVLIYCLAPSYGNVATALMQRSDVLTVANVTAALVEEEAHQKAQAEPSRTASLFKTTATLRAPRKEFVCFRCGEKGHKAMECPAARPARLVSKLDDSDSELPKKDKRREERVAVAVAPPIQLF
jgi:hypothetical protein